MSMSEWLEWQEYLHTHPLPTDAAELQRGILIAANGGKDFRFDDAIMSPHLKTTTKSPRSGTRRYSTVKDLFF